MRDYLKQAYRALEIYLQRGEEALRHLQQGETDEALELLQSRKAAFHNFRVAEAQVSRPITEDQRFVVLWQKIAELDSRLGDSLKELQDSFGKKIFQAKQSRVGFSKYKSGKLTPRKFDTPV